MARITTPSGERLATNGFYGDYNYRLRSIATGGWYDAAIVVPSPPDSYIGRRWREEVVLPQDRPHSFTISEDKILLRGTEAELAQLRATPRGDRVVTVISSTTSEDKILLEEVEKELTKLKAKPIGDRHRTIIRRTMKE